MAMTLSEAFGSFSGEALRLEGLPRYAVPEEADAVRTAQEGHEPDMSFLAGWLEHLDGVRQSGRRHRRLRLIGDPPTDYERFEVRHGYPLTLRAGEEIRLLERAGDQLPDCWIFDQHIVFRMDYDSVGRFEGAQEVCGADAVAIIERVREMWDQARPLTPHSDD